MIGISEIRIYYLDARSFGRVGGKFEAFSIASRVDLESPRRSAASAFERSGPSKCYVDARMLALPFLVGFESAKECLAVHREGLAWGVFEQVGLNAEQLNER